MSVRELLELVLLSDPEDVERELKVATLPPDQLVEALAGFMCERCDNMLANAEKPETRARIFELSEECRHLFLKAHARRRGLELDISSVSSAEELERAR